MSPKDKLKSIILNRFHGKPQSNGIWFGLSCPFCGDSPNPHTTHCNIMISPDENIVLVYCFQLKCKASGVMNRNHLRKMNIYDQEIIDFVEHNYHSSVERMNELQASVENWIIPNADKADNMVLDYFYARTKKHLDDNRIKRYRIVSNIKEFINLNQNTFSEYSLKKLQELSIHPYIGFLNDTGTNIELRAAGDVPKDKRFMKVSLIRSDVLKFVRHKPYTVYVENNYELCKNGYIVISEGKFDLINSIEHIFGYDCKGIWIATPAAGIRGVVKSATKIYPYRKLVIIADDDVTDFQIADAVYGIRYRVSSIEIVRNKVGKDLGDLREKVEPTKYTLNLNNYNSINSKYRRK